MNDLLTAIRLAFPVGAMIPRRREEAEVVAWRIVGERPSMEYLSNGTPKTAAECNIVAAYTQLLNAGEFTQTWFEQQPMRTTPCNFHAIGSVFETMGFAIYAPDLRSYQYQEHEHRQV